MPWAADRALRVRPGSFTRLSLPVDSGRGTDDGRPKEMGQRNLQQISRDQMDGRATLRGLGFPELVIYFPPLEKRAVLAGVPAPLLPHPTPGLLRSPPCWPCPRTGATQELRVGCGLI